MQVHAITKNVRMSAQKMREVVRQIGVAGDESAGGAGGGAAQVGARRRQDVEVGHRRARNNGAKLKIVGAEAVAGTATSYKRMTPKARGSGGPIIKRNCHVKIVLSDEA